MKKIGYSDDDPRIEVESPLMRESLINKAVVASTESASVRGLIPDLNVVSLGGHSIIDRGAKALLPLVDAISRSSAQCCRRCRTRAAVGRSGSSTAWSPICSAAPSRVRTSAR